MKEKVIFTLSLACFIGIMWLSSTKQTNNPYLDVSEETTLPPVENYPHDYIDDISPETTLVGGATSESDFSEVNACSIKPIETDVFTFGEAFHYYRQCLGSDRSFQWKGNTYTTLLTEEIIIHVADSVQVKEATKDNNEMSEIH